MPGADSCGRKGRPVLDEDEVRPEEPKEEPKEYIRRLDEVSDDLKQLADVLTAEEEVGRVLQRSVDQLVESVPGADMASVTVLSGEAGETVASSNERVWAIDSDQYAAGDGPCLEAARTGEVVRVGVEEALERWPGFTRSARAAGVASYLSYPLFIDDAFAGSLNLYSEQPHGFSDFDVALLRLYITAVTAAIANARRYAKARSLAENLGRALDSRALIDQAIGVVMARRGIGPEQAFDELSRESQNTNTKLRDLAARVVENASRPRK
jgi:GAF domain-containing protein